MVILFVVVCGEVNESLQSRSKSCTGAAVVAPTKLSAAVKLRWTSVVSSFAPMSA